MTDPIRAALDKAAFEMNPDGFRAYPTARRNESAVAIAAFLRALSEARLLELLAADDNPNNGWRDTLAEAVLAAAKEERE
jgi:hypothetical protein